jgi:leucyl aminopeptidase
MQVLTDTNPNNYECEVKFNFNTKDNTLLIKENDKFILQVNLKSETIKINKIKELVANISKILTTAKIKSVILPTLNSDFIKLATQSFVANSYQITKPHKDEDNISNLQTIAFNTSDDYADIINQQIAIGDGINFAKNLGDMPSNICTPTYLAEKAGELANKYNLECEILNTQEMEELGMGSLLSVAKGSVNPPKLISLSYKGAGGAKPIVLVGKGVTFDSGGISLKPGANMDEMKYDMSGAASVLGTMNAIAKIGAKVNLTIIIPAVENMPAHNASKPGDVVKSMSGQTIEILNTDAEGRLILCDALTYAKKFNPKTVIDIATLTGAVIIALGKHHSGIMGNNQALVDSLISAGQTSQDTVWQLPLDEEFDELLHSNFADMANIGGREAGTITAACFLARFTGDYNWAHLDIAGTAWLTGKQKGSTGRPVGLLCEYVLNN